MVTWESQVQGRNTWDETKASCVFFLHTTGRQMADRGIFTFYWVPGSGTFNALCSSKHGDMWFEDVTDLLIYSGRCRGVDCRHKPDARNTLCVAGFNGEDLIGPRASLLVENLATAERHSIVADHHAKGKLLDARVIGPDQPKVGYYKNKAALWVDVLLHEDGSHKGCTQSCPNQNRRSLNCDGIDAARMKKLLKARKDEPNAAREQ